jgi:HEPN domain-containing protein
MTRPEFQQIALLRLDEAEVLLVQGKYDGCCYLAGYALELALKAVICSRMDNDSFFEVLKSETARAFKIHNLAELVILAGLSKEYKELNIKNNVLLIYWEYIKNDIKWSEQLRYQMGITKDQAEKMILAINDPINGILEWIKKYW